MSLLYLTPIKKLDIPVITPADLPNQVLWLRGDSFTADTTSTWTDLYGNISDFTATTTARPTLNPTGLNGQPVVEFDGTANVMASGTSTILDKNSPYSLIIVMNHLGFGGANEFRVVTNFVAGSAYLNTIWLTNSASYGPFTFGFSKYAGPDNLNMMGCDPSLGSSYQGIITTYDNGGDLASNYSARSGNSLLTTSAFTTGSNAQNNIIGAWANGGLFFNGGIAEIILISSVLTPIERRGIVDYLNTRYGI